MLAKVEKKRPLSRYLKDFKHSQTHCCQCGKPLDRMSLVFRGQIINKEAIAGMDQLIDDTIWHNLSKELTALCRFCSVISCNADPNYFDIKAFKQYLFEQTAMSHSTIREYVVRLRRLDDILAARNYPHDKFDRPSGPQTLIDEVPDAGQSNYRIALRKYDQYLNWQRGI
jgi:FliZ protein